METNGAESAQGVHSRRYMSKSQRACDFCRERKSACRIEGGAPCQLCSYYKRECTFNSSSGPRKRRALTQTDGVATVAQPMWPRSNEPALQHEALVSTHRAEVPPQQMLGAQNIDNTSHTYGDAIFADLDDHLPTEGAPHDGVPDPGGSFDPFGDWFPSPSQLMNDIEGFETTGQLAIQEGRYCGLTGDMDPYLLRLYRFNEHSVFPFKKLAVRSIDAGHLPIQFLQNIKDDSEVTSPVAETDDVSRLELDAIVPHVVGVRLISL